MTTTTTPIMQKNIHGGRRLSWERLSEALIWKRFAAGTARSFRRRDSADGCSH